MAKVKLSTTKRAVMQNSAQAMKGQIRLALIELLTNSDDQYRAGGTTGAIRIEIGDVHRSEYEESFGDDVVAVVTVTDQAGGMDVDQMETKLTEYGNATSSLADGSGVSRGFLGRGAKDVFIFGYASFQTIHAGKYRELTMRADGEGEIFDSQIATEELRDRFGITDQAGGFRASVMVTEHNKEALQSTSALAKALAREAQLRFLLDDCHVTIEDKQTGKKEVISPELTPGAVILDEQIELKDFKLPISLKLYLLENEQTGEADAASSHGILVHSGWVAFENSWFGFRKESGTEWLRAELNLPEALDIQRAEGQANSAKEGLIKLDRSGLNQGHRYFQTAMAAVSPLVMQALATVSAEKRTIGGETESTKRASNAAAEALAQILKEFFEELDEDPGTGGGSTPQFSDFDAIPGGLRIGVGTKKTVTLRATSALATLPMHVWTSPANSQSQVITGPEGQLESTEWRDHPRLNRKVTQWRFEAGASAGFTSVFFDLGGHVAKCDIVVSDVVPGSETPPENLEFEREKYRVAPGRGKKLRLLSPLSAVGTKVTLKYSGVGCSGIEHVHLKASRDGAVGEATVQLTAGRAVGQIEVVALNESTSEEAITLVSVELDSSLKGFRPDLKVDATPNPSSRAAFRKIEGVYSSIIYPEHESYNGIFGKYDKKAGGYSRDSAPEVRAMMAISHSEQVARFMTERESDSREMDAAAVLQSFFRHNTRLSRILGKIYLEGFEAV